jgi:hypothetical protein
VKSFLFSVFCETAALTVVLPTVNCGRALPAIITISTFSCFAGGPKAQERPQVSIIDEWPGSGQGNSGGTDGTRRMTARPAWGKTWLSRYLENQGPGKIELDFTRLATKLSYTQKKSFTLERKG